MDFIRDSVYPEITLKSQNYSIRPVIPMSYIKLIKTNKNGIPDVLALHPDYGIEFYEIKTKKGKVSKLQEYRMKELKEYGFTAEVYRG